MQKEQVKIYQADQGKTPSAPTARARRPRGLVQEIVENLSSNIRDGLIKPGDKLPTEAEIMTRLSPTSMFSGTNGATFHYLV